MNEWINEQINEQTNKKEETNAERVIILSKVTLVVSHKYGDKKVNEAWSLPV